jgi:hypothetical protein
VSELFFGETTIRGRSVSLALDLEPALLFGVGIESMHGWREVKLHFGPFSMSLTLYRGRA